MEFDWDDANLEHVAEHGVEPEEAEEAALDSKRAGFDAHRGPNGERRVGFIGRTAGDRILVVILERRGPLTRVATARDATENERRRYRR